MQPRPTLGPWWCQNPVLSPYFISEECPPWADPRGAIAYRLTHAAEGSKGRFLLNTQDPCLLALSPPTRPPTPSLPLPFSHTHHHHQQQQQKEIQKNVIMRYPVKTVLRGGKNRHWEIMKSFQNISAGNFSRGRG